MNNTSKTILNILKSVFSLTYYFCWIILAFLLLICASKIFNINIDKLSEIKVNLGTYNGKIIDLISVDVSYFTYIMFYSIVSMILYIYLFKTVLKIIDAIKTKNPFKQTIYDLLFKTARILFAIGIVSFIFEFIISLFDNVFKIEFNLSTIQYILFSAIVYIIAQIYKQGIELKTENDLTI